MSKNHVSTPDRMAAGSRHKTTLAASVLMATALASPGHAADYAEALRLTAPTEAEHATGGMSQTLTTGQMAHRGANAPADVCPISGPPTAADFTSWFVGWSLQGVGGYSMANNPASYQPLLAPTPVISNGELLKFFIGAAPVKKVAMCVYPTAGPVDFQASARIVLIRIGLTDSACAPAANAPCHYHQEINPVLNSLFILERINEPDVEYQIGVVAPNQGSVGVHIGGRLGTYPTISN